MAPLPQAPPMLPPDQSLHSPESAQKASPEHQAYPQQSDVQLQKLIQSAMNTEDLSSEESTRVSPDPQPRPDTAIGPTGIGGSQPAKQVCYFFETWRTT